MRVYLKEGWAPTYPELWPTNSYGVVSVEGDNYRIVNDAGEPMLFSRRAFRVTDSQLSQDWVRLEISETVHYVPASLLEPRAFFERLIDGDPALTRRFRARMYGDIQSRGVPNRSGTRFVLVTKENGAEPSQIFLELDSEDVEIRRVEVSSSGHASYADAKGGVDSTELLATSTSDYRSPHAGSGVEILAEEFNTLWDNAVDAHL